MNYALTETIDIFDYHTILKSSLLHHSSWFSINDDKSGKNYWINLDIFCKMIFFMLRIVFILNNIMKKLLYIDFEIYYINHKWFWF